MLIRQKEYWQLRLGSLWITRVRPLQWGGKFKPGTLTVWLGQRMILSRLA
jgi:hypothetical protein